MPRVALNSLLEKAINRSSAAAAAFCQRLAVAEADLQVKFRDAPSILANLSIRPHSMGAGMLQVQLCEWRKFRKRIDKKRTIARGVVL